MVCSYTGGMLNPVEHGDGELAQTTFIDNAHDQNYFGGRSPDIH